MNAVSTLNLLAKQAVNFAWPMLWQSSLLIAFILALDLLLRKKVRPAVRCGLWLMVFAKLLLPPSFALPSGICWWLRHPAPKPAVHREARTLVSYVADNTDDLDRTALRAPVPSPGPVLTFSASCVLGWIGVSVGLLGWMVIRWRQVARQTRLASPPPDWLDKLLQQARLSARVRRQVGLKVGDGYESPAVYGLLRPIILIPQPLLQQLTHAQLRAVLLHELIHVRRADAWVSCAQALLQIVYWWQPLLWLANARIRRVREEAVDDAVMTALGASANAYVPTLVEVAKLALNRPLLNLALIGIFESQSSLRQRIDRLIDFHPPRKPGLTLVSIICILSLAALAVPMGEPPPNSNSPVAVTNSGQIVWPDSRFEGYGEIRLEPQFFSAEETALRSVLPSLIDQQEPLLFSSNEVAELDSRLQQAAAKPFTSAEPLSFAKFSGGTFHWSIGSLTNNWVNYLTRSAGEQVVVTGADTGFISSQPDWVPLQLTVVPWAADAGVRCQMRLAVADNPYSTQEANAIIPTSGAAVWAVLAEPNARKYELVILREKSGATHEIVSSSSTTNPAGGEVLADRASADRGLAPRSRDVKGAKAPEGGASPVVGGNTWRVESLSGEASSLEYDAAAGTIRATDGALVRYGQTMLRADQVTGVVSNHQLVELIAQGNVRLEQAQGTLRSDRLHIEFPDSTNGVATILDGSAMDELVKRKLIPHEFKTADYSLPETVLDDW